MVYFTNTNDWLRKTKENIAQNQEYNNKIRNNESTEMFKTIKRARTGRYLVPKYDITTYDETLLTFINETSEMCTHLQNRVLELEKKLENKNYD